MMFYVVDIGTQYSYQMGNAIKFVGAVFFICLFGEIVHHGAATSSRAPLIERALVSALAKW